MHRFCIINTHANVFRYLKCIFSRYLCISATYLCFLQPWKMNIHDKNKVLTHPISLALSAWDIFLYRREYCCFMSMFSCTLSHWSLVHHCSSDILAPATNSTANCSDIFFRLSKLGFDATKSFNDMKPIHWAVILQQSSYETMPTCWMISCIHQKPGFVSIFPVYFGLIWPTWLIRLF